MTRATWCGSPVLGVLDTRMVDHELLDSPKLLCRIVVDDSTLGVDVVMAFAEDIRVVAA